MTRLLRNPALPLSALVAVALLACRANEAPEPTEKAKTVTVEKTAVKAEPAAAPGQADAKDPAVAVPPLTLLPPGFGTEDEDVRGERVVLFLHSDLYAQCAGMALPTPNFPLDSAKPKYEDADELRALAKCMKTPPFDEATVTLIGRTDPRGTRTYNKALGEKRADSVKRVLIIHGIDAARIKTIAAGEPAPGVDVRSWEDARRVDVMLARGLEK